MNKMHKCWNNQEEHVGILVTPKILRHTDFVKKKTVIIDTICCFITFNVHDMLVNTIFSFIIKVTLVCSVHYSVLSFIYIRLCLF